MPKVLVICPNEIKKSFLKMLKKCGVFKEDNEIQAINPHVPPDKVAEKRFLFGATRVIYVGVEARRLGDYQAYMASRRRPDEKIIQCAVECKEPGRKPPDAKEVILFNSAEKMTEYLRVAI